MPDDITEQDWALMHKINSFGPFLGIKHASKYMKEAGKGSIVNTSSYTAIIGSGFNEYSASKVHYAQLHVRQLLNSVNSISV